MYSIAERENKFLKKVNILLFLFLFFTLASFFTWTPNVNVARVFKTVGRMSVLISCFYLYNSIIKFKATSNFQLSNPTVFIFYVLYLLLGFISFLWSTAPGYSALQWFMTVQSFVFAIVYINCIKLINQYFPDSKIRLYKILGDVIFVLILIFIIGMYVNPADYLRATDGGTELRLGGYIMNPNELGMLSGVGIGSLLFDFKSRNKPFTAFKIIALYFALYFTGSRSSLIGSFLIIIFYIFQNENTKLKVLFFTMMTLMAPVFIFKIILKGGNTERINEILSMTGRLPFWKALLTEGLPREPWFGFGFMRIDYNDYFSSVHTYAAKMTHNTFLQVLLNLGFVGFVIVLFQFIFTIVSLKKYGSNYKIFLIGIFFPILINSFTEFGIFGENNYGILFYQFIIVSISFDFKQYFTLKQKVDYKIKLKKLNSINS